LPHNDLRSDDPMSAAPATAVLLLNLGTLEALTPVAVRRYLVEFRDLNQPMGTDRKRRMTAHPDTWLTPLGTRPAMSWHFLP